MNIHCSTDFQNIVFACHGAGWIGQGVIEEVSAESYEDWKEGALAGIRYALKRGSHPKYRVLVTKIEGMTPDTTPSIVGGAAIQAVWAALEYKPSNEEQAAIDHIVFHSFSYPDAIPRFGP